MNSLNRNCASGISGILIFGAVWPLICPKVCATESTGLIAKAILVNGAARFVSNSTNWQPVHLGDEFAAGSCIQTAPTNAYVDIRLVRSSKPGQGAGTVRVLQNSALILEQLNSERTDPVDVNKIKVRLAYGRILVSFAVGSENEVELIDTSGPLVVAPQHGEPSQEETQFIYSHTGTVRVLKGGLRIRNAIKDEVLIKSGEQLNCETGEVVKAPDDSAETKPSR